MEKISNLLNTFPNLKAICWDLDGTLIDTEIMWFNMEKEVKAKYGNNLTNDEFNKYSEEIAANAYKNWGYRASADKALKYFDDNNIYQVVINKCDLTNRTILKNQVINSKYSFKKFNNIISEKNFEENFSDEEMYTLALTEANIKDFNDAIAICDMPHELEAAKNSGLVTIWAKNNDYPFTDEEIKEILNLADYYVEDFMDLIK